MMNELVNLCIDSEVLLQLLMFKLNKFYHLKVTETFFAISVDFHLNLYSIFSICLVEIDFSINIEIGCLLTSRTPFIHTIKVTYMQNAYINY